MQGRNDRAGGHWHLGIVVVAVALVVVAGTLVAGPLSPAQPAGAVPTIQPKASPGGGLTLQNGQISFTAFYCRGKGVRPGATQTYTVPANTHSVYVDAVGGAGQTPNPNQTGYGGQAGEVTGGLNVTPGEKLPVDVGCQGSSGGGPSAFAPGGARGKGDSGVTPCCYFDSYSGGGGGGASAVLTPNRAPLVVAGGGGGAAGDGGSCVRYDIVVTVFECDNGPDGDGGNGGYGDSSGTDSSGGIGTGNPNPAAADGDNCPAAGGVAVAGQKGQDLVLSGPLNQQGTLQGAGGAGGGGGGGYSGPGIGGGACGGSAGGQNPDFGSNTVRVYSFPAGNGGGGGASWASGSVDSPTTDLADVGGDGFVLFITSADGVRKHNFNYAGSRSQYFCVPDGVDELFVDAMGGAGAGAGSGFHGIGNGGAGAGVQAVVPVAERTQLQVLAGEFGHGGGGFGAGHGGSHGISDDEKTGAGGGGSSGLFSTTEECGAKFNHNKPSGRTTLVVAGGGGGGGGNGGGTGGGNGGTGGTPQGGNGQAGSGYTGGNPGGCGGVPIGGQPVNCGEAPNGSTRGGDGTHANTGGGGGGGGGGYLGGGKGRGAAGGTDGGGSGGGGGASYVTSHTPQAPHYYLGPPGNLSNHDHLDDGHIDLVVPVPTHRSQVQVVSGDKQSAYPGQPFSAPLIARYVDAINGPQGRVPVILQLDPSNGGPAAVFPNGKSSIQLTTNQQGLVSTTLTSVKAGTAHRAAGAFKVDAYAANDPAHLITAANFVLHNSALPTTVTLTSSSPDNSPINGQPFHVMAQVAVSPGIHNTWGTPTGTVQFSVDQRPLGAPVPLDAGGTAASTAIGSLGAGTHFIMATYSGDASHQLYEPGSGVLPQVVTAARLANVQLSSSNPSAVDGQMATYTATVTPSTAGVAAPGAPGSPRPSGTVRFSLDGTPFGAPVALAANGTAVSVAVPLAINRKVQRGRQAHQVSATYSGNTVFKGGTALYSQYVRWSTTLSTTSSQPVISGTQTTQFTTAIEGSWPRFTFPAHTGTMQLVADGKPLGSPFPVTDLSTVSPPVIAEQFETGAIFITVLYSGDDNYGPAVSPIIVQRANSIAGLSPPTTGAGTTTTTPSRPLVPGG